MRIYVATFLLFLGGAISGIAAGASPPLAIPKDFLDTNLDRPRQALATPITAEFANSSIQDFARYLGQKHQVNIVLQLTHTPPTALPTFTGHFEHTPLRAVLYQFSRDTHLAVDWFYAPDHPQAPRAIRIHD